MAAPDGRAPGTALRASVLALLAAQLWLSLLPALGEIRNDFANYYAPARLIWDRGPLDRLYERDAFQAEVRRAGLAQIGSFVPHPPPNALLLLPLAWLPPSTAKAAWTLLLAVAYAATLPVLRALTGLSGWSVALVLLLPSASLANALAYGQPYPLLLLLLSASLLLLERGHAGRAGLLLAPVLALKLYAVPHAAWLAVVGRWRAAGAVLAGAALVLAASVLALGVPVHAVYLREVLPWSLRGEIQDPYSPLWGGFASLVHRLFQREPDLNPAPALDAPALVAPLAAAFSALPLLLALAARPRPDARRHWAALTLAALAASPLTQSYHFLLLALPAALLLGEDDAPAPAILLLLAFATSPLPHHFAPLAHGWSNPLAYPRLWAVAGLLLVSLRGLLSRARLGACLAACAVVGGFAALAAPKAAEPGWPRLPGASGYLAAEPVACEGGWAWLSVEADRYVVRRGSGPSLGGRTDQVSPRCVAGRLSTVALPPAGPFDDDWDADAQGVVRVDRREARLLAEAGGQRRVLAHGRFRRPRLSPDGSRIAVAAWGQGSWDIWVVERRDGSARRLTRSGSNEIEPAWSEDGTALVFASDRRRGLGSTALYRVPAR